jgi:predicted DsbA family dithiol-disulfide isomerase
MAPLTVDFVSDVVCPWCLIGLTRLEQALDGADVELRMRPFQLDASTPPEGVDLRERLRARYDVDPEKMFSRVEQTARESGIPLDFAKVRRWPSTLKAHALVGAAAEKGAQLALGRALFRAYFLEGRDVGEDATLLEIAAAHGFTRGDAAKIIGDEDALAAVRAEAGGLSAQGITGVPFTVFGGRLAVSGAQPVDAFRQALERARAEVSRGASVP